MKPGSLYKRFFFSTIMVAAVVMSISAVVVELTFKKQLELSSQEKLRLHIFNLLSISEINQGQLRIPYIVYNPRFNTPDSGLWAVVYDATENIVWQSLSIDSVPAELELSDSVGSWHFSKQFYKQTEYLTASYQITWEDNSQHYAYHLVVAENVSVMSRNVRHFRVWLIGAFVFITAALLLSQLLALRLSFRPIKQLENEITQLEQGQKTTLSDNYPRELMGVTQNLNALIDKEHQQRLRYRAGMADLAHNLKTPMAVIRAELSRYSDNSVLQNSMTRIDKSIEYQLRRAVISGHSLHKNGTQIQHVLNLVIEALDKVYLDKSIVVETHVNASLLFPGDENDLMEILGNLLDNAYKYADKYIRIRVLQCHEHLLIHIEDDGPGLSKENNAYNIFGRGERLDSQGLGQGIGLAVVVDIVKSYQGCVEVIKSAHLGGAEFKIKIPCKGTVV